MGVIRAGVISLLVILACCVPSFGQARGSVDTIGFNNHYRPECWTPLIITLTPQTGKSDQFQIQVKQEDMDRDYPIFTRLISLTGNTEGGGQRQQHFRMYFKPQPTGDGLPDANDPSRTLKDLQDLLQVSLCSATGKWLAPLPVTTTIINLEPKVGPFTAHRGTRVVLTVSDGRSAAVWRDYEAQGVGGVLDDIKMIQVQPRDLPESVLGYDAVDAIVWLNADPAELKSGTDEKYRALQSYVRRGGSLVICTPADWQKMLAFADLLPVTIAGTDSKNDPEPLRTLIRTGPRGGGADFDLGAGRDGWDNLRGPFTLAKAIVRPGAQVIDWIEWKNGDRTEHTPWLVRKPYGAGAIAWVAQDLGDPSVTRAAAGWTRVWDRVLDLRNQTLVPTVETGDDQKNIWAPAAGIDIGNSLLNGMELQSKSWGLITLAVVFFIGYWLFAGPGVYAYLASKRQTRLSWFTFAASALVATALTVVVVRLTLRGAPDMRHISLVRAATGEPATVYSRFGLYIPRDGVQQIELKDMAPSSLATITAFAIHPQHLDSGTVPQDAGPEYHVMVRDADSQEPAVVRVPYRSTLKKFEADWTGDIGGRVEGSAKLLEQTTISGILTNGTGKVLRNVYIAFHYPQANRDDDYIAFVPSWDPSVSIDLSKEFNPKTSEGRTIFPADARAANAPNPERGDRFRGTIRDYWQVYWSNKMRSKLGPMSDAKFDDFGEKTRASIPMLSFFSRLTPLKNERGQTANRFEFLRRAARRYDVSAALGAGALVVIAETDGVPIPFPLEVEGDRINGSGNTVYQFILPLDSSALTPATQPSE